MEKMKKLGMMALVMICAVGCYFVSGTYAKYTSTISGTSTATVAKWAWEIGGETIESVAQANASHTFDIFDTILDSYNSSGDTSGETDVASGLIAPGTSGKFSFDIVNNSEVNAAYTVTFTETNANSVPIEYSSDGGSTWGTAASLSVNAATPVDMGATESVEILWRWAFTGAESSNFTSSQTDSGDTALGFAANTSAPTVQVTANVVVTQVD